MLDARATALFLDLDGTLAAIESRPDLVGPDPRRTALLSTLADDLDGRLAVLSGRSLDEVDRILEGAVMGAAGVHGLERRRADGSRSSHPPHPAVDEAQAAFEAFANETDGLLVERKPQSVALHYRIAPFKAADVAALAAQIAEDTGLVLQRGGMVAELRTPGSDKGDALRAFMSEAPFISATPVMVGDDLTDEDAFAAAQALGGFGVLVGPDRVTTARFRLPDVEAVLAWLAVAARGRQAGSPSPRVNPCPA
jgi:trehalose 6-phosphate phosphatase